MTGTPSTRTGPAPRRTVRLDPNADGIGAAAAILRRGGLAAFPTETVYGLGGDGSNAGAVAALYAAKGRPRFNPLIAHVQDVAAARREGMLDEHAERLAAAFWPGPLTLVVPRAPSGRVSDLARAGLDSVALRVPAHPVARALLAAVDAPVVAPSANLSGRVSPTNADHVLGDLDGLIDAVLDGGPTEVGLESTIVSCLDDGPRLLRPGAVTRQALVDALGQPVIDAPCDRDAPLAPGALASHYAPRARVRLEALEVHPGEAALLFGGTRLPGTAIASIDLSRTGDLAEAASRLFAALRELDATGAFGIAIAPIPGNGLGEAINDRLRRAAAPR